MYSQKQSELANKNSLFNCDIETYQRIKISLEQQENSKWGARCEGLLAASTTFLDCSSSFLGEIQVNLLKTLFIHDSETLTTLSLKHNNLFRKALFISAFSSHELTTIAEALYEPLKTYCSVSVADPQVVVEQFLTLPDEAIEQLQPIIPEAILSMITAKLPHEEETLISIFSAIPKSVLYLDLSDNALYKADTFVLKQAFQSLHKGLRVIELSRNGFYHLPVSVQLEILAALPSNAEFIINDEMELQDSAACVFSDDVTLTGSSLSSQSPSSPPTSPTHAQQSFFPSASSSTEKENYVVASPTVPVVSGVQ